MSSVARKSTLQRKLAAAHFKIAQFPLLSMRHPNGGLVTIRDAQNELDQLRSTVRFEQSAGSYRHDTNTAFQRGLVVVLPILDGAILLWFLIGVLNVDVRHPGITLMISVAFALLATVVIAAWHAAAGHRLRVHKSDDRGLLWDALEAPERTMIAISILVSLLLAAMMFVRLQDEIFLATGLPASAMSTIVSATLAAAIVVLNLYVLISAFHDGSDLTHRERQLARRVKRRLRRYERNQEKAARLTEHLRQMQGQDGRPPELTG